MSYRTRSQSPAGNALPKALPLTLTGAFLLQKLRYKSEPCNEIKVSLKKNQQKKGVSVW
ncbi:MAG: hypothetical protein AAFV71_32600 [Cyanobacteria bacterium J06633_8]